MRITIDLELPEGWQLNSVWRSRYGPETERWTADAVWYSGDTGMTAASRGATPQEALERLPDVVQEHLRRLGMTQS